MEREFEAVKSKLKPESEQESYSAVYSLIRN